MLLSPPQVMDVIEQEDAHSAQALLPLVYGELRRLAAQRLSREKPGQTLQATALVHEAFVRLASVEDHHWDNRGHFFAAAAEAMRRILVERARRKRRLRHGGGRTRVDFCESQLTLDQPSHKSLRLEGALAKLADEDRQLAELVKLRFFVGLTMKEAACVLGISLRTAERNWTYARAWLHSEFNR